MFVGMTDEVEDPNKYLVSVSALVGPRSVSKLRLSPHSPFPPWESNEKEVCQTRSFRLKDDIFPEVYVKLGSFSLTY